MSEVKAAVLFIDDTFRPVCLLVSVEGQRLRFIVSDGTTASMIGDTWYSGGDRLLLSLQSLPSAQLECSVMQQSFFHTKCLAAAQTASTLSLLNGYFNIESSLLETNSFGSGAEEGRLMVEVVVSSVCKCGKWEGLLINRRPALNMWFIIYIQVVMLSQYLKLPAAYSFMM